MGAPQTPKFISQLLLKTEPPMGVFLYQKNKKIQTKKKGKFVPEFVFANLFDLLVDKI